MLSLVKKMSMMGSNDELMQGVKMYVEEMKSPSRERNGQREPPLIIKLVDKVSCDWSTYASYGQTLSVASSSGI